VNAGGNDTGALLMICEERMEASRYFYGYISIDDMSAGFDGFIAAVMSSFLHYAFAAGSFATAIRS
jgi:hypothetical protein